MNKFNELYEKISSKKVKVEIWDGDAENKLGETTLLDYEANHFDLSKKPFPAKIAFNDDELKKLKLDGETYINISKK